MLVVSKHGPRPSAVREEFVTGPCEIKAKFLRNLHICFDKLIVFTSLWKTSQLAQVLA